MCLVGVVVRRYIDFLIILIPTPLVSVLFCSSIPTFCSFKKMFFIIIISGTCALVVPWHVSGFGYATDAVYDVHQSQKKNCRTCGKRLRVGNDRPCPQPHAIQKYLVNILTLD